MKIKAEIKSLNAILDKLCIENEVPRENVWINEPYGYVENMVNKKDVDFCTTTYRGRKYKVQYFSGCFYPFIKEQLN